MDDAETKRPGTEQRDRKNQSAMTTTKKETQL
jgi:hypothetical protein